MLVFVVGSLRSGTSLLHALLNQHPSVALMYESHVLNFRPIVEPHRVRRDWALRLDFWNGAFTRHGLDPADFPCPGTAREAALLLYHAFRVRKGALIFGEKAPVYIHRLDAIAETFPEARFIVIWRDAADVYRSILRAAMSDRVFSRLGRLSFVVTALDRFQASVERLLASHTPVHQLPYEALVEDTVKSMKDACGFLDIPFVESMARLDGADLSIFPAGEHHALLRQAEIVRRPTPSSDGLASDAQRKIARYRSRWRERFPNLTPSITGSGDASVGPPTGWELLADRSRHGVVLGQVALARRLYALTPIPIWRTYRRLR
jgi:hypothetical protein